MEEGKRWITWKGRRFLVKDNGMITKQDYAIDKKFIKAEKLSTKEYDKLRNDFERSLTDKEKQQIEYYTSGGSASAYLNDRKNDSWKQKYRFVDTNNPKGYREEMLSDLEAFNTQLDKEALNIITDKSDDMFNKDKIIKSNYERMQHFHKEINAIDKIFKEKGVSLDKDIIVFRKGHESLEDIEKGAIRYGYTSTSAMPRINKQTPGGLELGNNEFEIIIPAGMKFLPVENIANSDLKKQHEILLPRNIKFKLINDKSKEASVDFTKKRFLISGENRYLVRAEEVKNDKKFNSLYKQ